MSDKDKNQVETKIYCLDGGERDEAALREAAEILRRGGIVAFPTETVYGLGANGLDGDAVRRIFAAKGRPADNPLLLHVPDDTWLARYCKNIPEAAYALTRRFWPGPLTIILEKRDNVSDVTTAGLPTVGMRCPRNAETREMIRLADVPVAAPSANRSGRPSTTTFGHVLADMDGRADAILDGGDCDVGVESAIVDLTVTPPRLLRPGGVTPEELREVLGEVEIDSAVTRLMGRDEKPRAPGMKYRHYAPKAPLTAVCGKGFISAEYIREKLAPGDGVLCWDEFATEFPGHAVFTYGPENDKKAQAVELFDALRKFDETDAGHIWAQCPDDRGVGLAVANRLKKAAGFDVTDLTMTVVGITGGTGAGKTTALEVLGELGTETADCDRIYHGLLDTSGEMLAAIENRFPGAVKGGVLDRKTLGGLVFRDRAALDELGRITHGYVLRDVARMAVAAALSGKKRFAMDAIALLESGYGALCDLTVAVTAPEDVRVGRIMAREGISREYAVSRVRAQKTDDWYRERCDAVLENDGDLEAFREKCRSFFGAVLEYRN